MRKIFLSGRLAANAEQKVTKNGTPFIEFRIGNNEYTGSAENNGRETYWFRVTSFNPNHAKLAQYLTKGKSIEVIGDLKASPYISTQTNKPEAGLEVTANDIMFDNNFGNPQNADGTANNTTTTTAAPQTPQTTANTAQTTKKTTPRNPTTTPITAKTAAPAPAAPPTDSNDDTDDLPF